MIKRIYFNKLLNQMLEPEISILLGARQVGKSTLMRQLESAAKKRGFKTAFYDLEQSADLNEFSGDEETLFKKLTEDPKKIIFIDEFHYLKNASKLFKAIFDSKKEIKIYASGSSSLEIHKHLKESLAGRFIKTKIYPLILSELEQGNFEEKNYLQWGGMPGLVNKNELDRMSLLENIVSTYLTKDIKALIQEENIRSFNAMLYLLAQSQGSVVSAPSLSNEIALSESTIARYLEIMSQTYVLNRVDSFSQNLANELKKSKKYYLFDLGIRNALLKDFSCAAQREDKGVLHETAVFLLLQTQIKPNMEIRFWRTKKGDEVDFILLKNRIPIPMEVKSKLKAPDLPKGLITFLKKYPKAPFGIVFNEEFEGERKVESRTVYFKKWSSSQSLDFMKGVL